MDEFCRICSRCDQFQKFELSTISQISNVRIDDMLVYCTQQQVATGDSLPQHICAECFAALNSAFVFRKLTYHSENGFRQMINSNLTASEPSPSEINSVFMTAEMTDPSLEKVAVKAESIELEEPSFIVGNIPVDCLEALPIEDNPVCPVSDPTAEGNQPKIRRRRAKILLPTRTAYLCNDCGYTTQQSYNFKRHQQTHNHSAHSKIYAKRPLYWAKDPTKPMKKPKIPKPPKPPKSPKPPAVPDVKLKSTKIDRITRRPRNSGRALYRCDDCGYQNNISFNFRRHQKNWNHTNVTMFEEEPMHINDMLQCVECGREFPSNAHLMFHHRHECQAWRKSRESDNDYSSENVDIETILSDRGTEFKQVMVEQMAEVKMESKDDAASPTSSFEEIYEGDY